jgi:transcriptional regulator with XRE-family HTH domain
MLAKSNTVPMKECIEFKMQTQIGKKICYYRKIKGFTQEDLALLIARHRENISKIERGLNDVRISTLIKIAWALDIEVKKLLSNEDKHIPAQQTRLEKVVKV